MTITQTAQLQEERLNWMRSRISRTSDSLDRAFESGLTGHVITGRQGKRVLLEDGTEAVEFVSCSYLGLETHPELVAAAADALSRFGVHFAISRNRTRPIYLAQLEDLLSTIFGGAQAVAFSSVSNVHLGLLPLLGTGALPSYPVQPAGAAFLVERTAHASIQVIRGVLEQIGPVRRFDLSRPESLPAGIGAAVALGRTPIVLVDGVGSMGGLIPVAAIREELKPWGGHLYVDDAHGTSIAGPQGAGYAYHAFGGQLPPGVVLAGSLSKAFGGAGGFAVVPGQDDVRVLENSPTRWCSAPRFRFRCWPPTSPPPACTQGGRCKCYRSACGETSRSSTGSPEAGWSTPASALPSGGRFSRPRTRLSRPQRACEKPGSSSCPPSSRRWPRVPASSASLFRHCTSKPNWKPRPPLLAPCPRSRSRKVHTHHKEAHQLMSLTDEPLLSADERVALAGRSDVGGGNLLAAALAINSQPDVPFIRSDRPLINTAGEEQTDFSLRQLDQLAQSWSVWYYERGVRPRDRVAIFIADSFAYMVHFCRARPARGHPGPDQQQGASDRRLGAVPGNPPGGPVHRSGPPGDPWA